MRLTRSPITKATYSSLFFSLCIAFIIFLLWKALKLPFQPVGDITGRIASPGNWRIFLTLSLPILTFLSTAILIACQAAAPRPPARWERVLWHDCLANFICSLLWLLVPIFWKLNCASATYVGIVFILWFLLKGFALLTWVFQVTVWNRTNALCTTCILWVLLGGLAAWAAQTSTYSDAVKYLLFTHSIVKHRTIDVTETVRNKEYRSFYWGKWHKEFIHDKPADTHAQLTPYALAIPYAFAGRLGILLFFSLLLAAGISLTAGFVVNAGVADIKPALTAAIVGLTSSPVLFLSHVEFPDTIGLFLLSLSLYVLTYRKHYFIRKFLIIASITILAYYIKNRLVIVFAGVLFALFFDLCRSFLPGRRKQVAAGIFLFCSMSFFLFLSIYRRGLWQNYDPFTIIYSSLTGMFAGQNFGLFIAAPVFMLSLLSLYECVPRYPSFFTACLFPIFASISLIVGLNWFAWHGGFSPPFRYLAYTLPLWSALLAFWAASKVLWRKTLFWLLTALGGIYTLSGLLFPVFQTNRPIRANTLLMYLEKYAPVELHTLLPSVFLHPENMNLWCLNIAAFFLLILFYLWLAPKPFHQKLRLQAAGGLVFFIVVIGSILYEKSSADILIDTEMMTSESTSLWSPTNHLHMRGRVFHNKSTSSTVITVPRTGRFQMGFQYIAQVDGTVNIYFDNTLVQHYPITGTATPKTREQDRRDRNDGLTRGFFPNRARRESADVVLQKGEYTVTIECGCRDGRGNWLLLDYFFLSAGGKTGTDGNEK